MGIDAGSLDRRIRIERATSTDDGYQSRPAGWVELTTVWARYTPAKGAERFDLASREARMPVAFTIRWSSQTADVTTADRVIYDNKTYDIAAVTEIGRRDGLEFQCLGSDRG